MLSKHDHTLAIVDPSSLRVVARVPVGDDPHEVVASADGRIAYVSNYGFGAFHTLAVVDLVAQRAEPPIDLGALRGPHGLAFAQGKVWFTAEVAKAIGSYDPGLGKVNWIMGTGQNRTHMLYVFPDAQKIVTTNVNSATVTVLEHSDGQASGPPPPPPPPGSGPGWQGAGVPPPGAQGGPRRMPGPPGGDWNETVIPVGGGAEGFDVSPDGKQAWVANAWDGTISVIDLAQKKVTATLQANVRGANRLKFTPDEKRALVSAGGELVVFDVATQKELKRLRIGKGGGGGVLVQPDGARVYVAYAEDGFVAVVDLKTLEVVGRVEAGANPDGLAWAVRE
ncbi:YncE family protein [Occallatibacter savannae]|uniref:YncE family protein n=1 Tax=Occallatibacter savannae TaxID=1002691 RepID=UPI0019523974|nr:YncE family protein [Occallatibacter savannae]